MFRLFLIISELIFNFDVFIKNFLNESDPLGSQDTRIVYTCIGFDVSFFTCKDSSESC